MLIRHITLLTNNTAVHRLDTLDSFAVAACRALLPAGGPVPHFAGFRVHIELPTFTILRGDIELVVCCIGLGHDAGWAMMVQLQEEVLPPGPRQQAGGRVQAPAGQWLCVVIFPGLATLSREDLGWLGDFERCLAAAILLPAS